MINMKKAFVLKKFPCFEWDHHHKPKLSSIIAVNFSMCGTMLAKGTINCEIKCKMKNWACSQGGPKYQGFVEIRRAPLLEWRWRATLYHASIVELYCCTYIRRAMSSANWLTFMGADKLEYTGLWLGWVNICHLLRSYCHSLCQKWLGLKWLRLHSTEN